jgi:hypothetical protein
MDYPALLDAIEARLREMQARAEAATPGPWRYMHVGGGRDAWLVRNQEAYETVRRDGMEFATYDGRDLAARDAELIAHARTDLPALVGWALERVATLQVVFAQIAAEGELRLSPMIQALADQSRLLLEREIESLARALGVSVERD